MSLLGTGSVSMLGVETHSSPRENESCPTLQQSRFIRIFATMAATGELPADAIMRVNHCPQGRCLIRENALKSGASSAPGPDAEYVIPEKTSH